MRTDFGLKCFYCEIFSNNGIITYNHTWKWKRTMHVTKIKFNVLFHHCTKHMENILTIEEVCRNIQ